METFGDRLFRRVSLTRNMLFLQGEIAQLTYQSFVKFIEYINESNEAEIEITYPVGYMANNTTIDVTKKCTKEVLIERYEFLCLSQLPVNGIYQLVTTTEALLGDILRNTLIEFPSKISNKRKLDFELVLEAKSLEEIKINLVNSLINELTYKPPKEFAEEFNKYVGVNLLEKPAFHKYIELKATRDIYIHNLGVANDIYLSKAATFARVKSGQYLPVDVQYFLQSYESCLQITEVLDESLNNIWPSLEYQMSKQQSTEQQKAEAIEHAIELAEQVKPTKKATKPVKKVAKKG